MIIYKTTNLINGKIYVGKACGSRVTNNYLGSGKLYRRAEKKYGKENFKRITIDIAENRKEQCLKEIFWIDFYDARNPAVGYNITEGGDGGATRRGMKNSEETNRKIGEANVIALTGRKLSDEHKQNIRKNHKGMLGKHLSEETKQKISILKKELYKNPENNPMFGQKRSEETKRKQSITNSDGRNKGQNNPMSKTNRAKRRKMCSSL